MLRRYSCPVWAFWSIRCASWGRLCSCCCAPLGGSRRLLRTGLIFFAVAAAFGGGIFAIELLGGRGLSLKNGLFYSAMDLKLILLSAAGCYVVISLVLRRTGSHTARRELVPAVVTLGERKAMLTALVGTGNTLRMDRVQVGTEDYGGILVALSPNRLSDGGGYSALIGA